MHSNLKDNDTVKFYTPHHNNLFHHFNIGMRGYDVDDKITKQEFICITLINLSIIISSTVLLFMGIIEVINTLMSAFISQTGGEVIGGQVELFTLVLFASLSITALCTVILTVIIYKFGMAGIRKIRDSEILRKS